MARTRRSRRTLTATVAAAGLSTLGLLGGSYAAFQAQAAAPAQQIGTGTAAIAVQSTQGGSWTSTISNLAAGDTAVQYLNLVNTGSLNLATLTLGQTNLGTALAGTNGLSVEFDSCTIAWSSTNTCGGTQTLSVLPTTTLSSFTSAVTLMNGTADFTLAANTTAYLRETIVLNQAAPNTDQGLTEKVTYTFNGTAATTSGTAPAATTQTTTTSTVTGPTLDASAVWSSAAAVPVAVDGLAAADSGGMVYELGGAGSGGVVAATNTVSQYNPSTNAWTTMTPMPTAITNVTAATDANGNIYVIGGLSSANAPVSTVYKYTPSTNTWVSAASLPQAISAAASATDSAGNIYLIGGSTASAVVSTVYKYTPSTNTWVSVASLPNATEALAAVASTNGEIYAVGGENSGGSPVSTVEAYNPSTNAWTSEAPLPTARFYLSAGVDSSGNVYAIDGYNTSALGVVEKYDPTTNAWSSFSGTPTAAYGLAAASDPSGIYAFGGYNNGFVTANNRLSG